MWQRSIGLLQHASTLMERLITDGDGSRLNISKIADIRVGKLSSRNF